LDTLHYLDRYITLPLTGSKKEWKNQ